MTYTLRDISQQLGSPCPAHADTAIIGLSTILDISEGHLVFADSEQYLALAEASPCAAILLPHHLTSEQKPYLQVSNPLISFGQLLTFFYPPIVRKTRHHQTAVISDDATIGEGCHIGAHVVIEAGCVIGAHSIIEAGCVIGHNVRLGEHCHLHPNVAIYDNCKLGADVIIHASSVIGADGFGYVFDGERHQKIPHVGHVVIEDNVEIGANTVIDKATLGATRIGAGTKIDNFVQVAHNVRLGQHNILCGFTGIAGSSTSGNNVIFAANAGVSDHVTIEDNVIIGPRAGVPSKKTLPKNTSWLGNPARPEKKAIEQMVTMQRLPALRKVIKELQARVSALEK